MKAKMKKLFLMLSLAILIFVFSLASVSAVFISPCGPSLPPVWCQTSTNCGAKECTARYKAIDDPASDSCKNEYDKCTKPQVIPNGCGEGVPKYICKTDGIASAVAALTGMEFPSCGAPTCIIPCQKYVENGYKTIESTAVDLTEGFVSDLILKGTFTDIVPCNEMDSCYKEVKLGNLKSFDRLKCDGIEQSTYEKIIREYGKTNKADLENNLPFEKSEVQQALMKEEYVFENDNKFVEFLRKCVSCDKNALSDYATKQEIGLLAKENVRAAMNQMDVHLPWWKQALVTAWVLKDNTYVRIAGIGLSALSAAKGIYSLLADGDDESSDNSRSGYHTTYKKEGKGAQDNIDAALNSEALGNSRWIDCPDDTVQRSQICLGARCVKDDQTGASQCITALPGEEVEVKFGSIHIIDKKLNAMFTLTGDQNEGVVYQEDGYINIHKGGTTRISVSGYGVFVTDTNKNQLFVGKGTTNYFGDGNANQDTYLTNSFILDQNSKVAVFAVNEQNSNGQEAKLALTINHNSLQQYKNIIDIARLKDAYKILMRGISDAVLVESDKVFPFMTRNFAKGNSLVVINKNVQIPNSYLVDDGSYKYYIKTIDASTKVMAENGKIIEDSGPLDYKLSKRQSLLVYGS